MALTPKQEKFVQGLFAGFSQRKAYKLAFNVDKMKDETIDNMACKLSKENEISARLTQLQDEVKEKNKWTVERLIERFETIGDRCMQAEAVKDNQGLPTGEYKFDSAGANKSTENIGKLLGYYTEQIKHSGEIVVFKGDEHLED